jgi:hypothetical protein
MNQRVNPSTLYSLRNNIGIDSVLYALEIPWKRDDMKLRFICPKCHGLDTSVHPKVNLGRCFSCPCNFNTIDLVMAAKGYPFRQAVDWLVTIQGLLELDDGQRLLARQARRSRMV